MAKEIHVCYCDEDGYCNICGKKWDMYDDDFFFDEDEYLEWFPE